MKRLALVLGMALLTGCNATGSNESGAKQASPQPLAKGSVCSTDSFESTDLTHCIADPARHRIAMALGPKGGAPYRSIMALISHRPKDAPKMAFAMNGGMFGDDGKPIGYYVESSKRLHTLNRAKGGGNFHLLPNGVFYGSGTAWAVASTETFANTVQTRPEFATQSGPMLVIGGKLHPQISEDGQSQFIRNAVGVDEQGRAHFVISEGTLSFGKLARYFRDVLKVQNALFLDGNVSALWDAPSGRIDETVPLGPLIVVENRTKAGK
jgi:uncharacterized protein YigE (DUF2233 family)